MIALKSREQMQAMRPAGRLVAQALQRVRQMIRPGVTTAELDAAVAELFQKHGATPLFKGVVGPGGVPFPAVTCISVNEEIVHGIPGPRVLAEGDLVSVDTGCRIDGWCGDAAWTFPVGEVDQTKQRLLEVGRQALETAIREMGRAERWSQVAAAIQKTAHDAGFEVVEALVGHGIGREMHEDPQVPNYVSDHEEDDFPLEPGLALAIEPMVVAGSREVELLDDQWTIVTVDRRPGVHFEHTVCLTEDGPWVTTSAAADDSN